MRAKQKTTFVSPRDSRGLCFQWLLMRNEYVSNSKAQGAKIFFLGWGVVLFRARAVFFGDGIFLLVEAIFIFRSLNYLF